MPATDGEIPYEILIRWSETGELQGAHYITRPCKMLDGEVIAILPPKQPIPLRVFGSGQNEFPQSLQEVMNSIQAGFVIAADAAVASRAAAIEELSKVHNTLVGVVGERDEAQSELRQKADQVEKFEIAQRQQRKDMSGFMTTLEAMSQKYAPLKDLLDSIKKPPAG